MIAFDIETMGLDARRHAVTVVCTECLFTGERKAFEFARLAHSRRAVEQGPGDADEKATQLLVLDDQRNIILQDLVKTLDEAPSICAFNGVRFDVPFLMQAFDIPQSTGTAWVLKMTDILEACRLLHKHTFKLDLLCQINGLPMKTGTGLAAIEMARNAEFDKLRDYCADDVHILCNLYRKQHLRNPRSPHDIDLAQWCHTDIYDILMALDAD
jgi:DNA polymerase III epsilon subunit-like protein